MRRTPTALSLLATTPLALLLASCAEPPPPPNPSRAVIGGYVGERPPPSAPPVSPSPSPTVPPAPAGSSPVATAGGTLLALTHGGANRVVVGDVDDHRLVVVDLGLQAVVRTVQLAEGEQPRRLVELPDGRVAATLSRDALVIITPDGEAEPVRVPVCALPRGLALDAAEDRLLVVCREGLLVEVPLATLAAARSTRLPRDLRDVVVAGERIYVTRFKSAEVLLLDRALTLQHAVSLSIPTGELALATAVAWRAAALADGSLRVLHQRARVMVGLEQVPELSGGSEQGLRYGGVVSGGPPCARPVVTPAISVVHPDGTVLHGPALARSTLMVDVAVRGGEVLMADAGALTRRDGRPVRHFSVAELGLTSPQVPLPAPSSCAAIVDDQSPDPTGALASVGEAVVGSVAFDKHGRAVALIDAPLTVVHGLIRIPLGSTSRDTLGHRLFHQDAALGVACASCHPEGEEDGLVWNLPLPRRTPALGGGLLDSAPFHWAGDLRTLDALYAEVFQGRMGGDPLNAHQSTALTRWLEAMPAIDVPTPLDPAAVARGAQVAARPALGCNTCHVGATRRVSVDVGTGEALQVPSLRGLMFRAPYLHDGCATTLEDRFGRCATPGHGQTGGLTARDQADLIAYLESL